MDKRSEFQLGQRAAEKTALAIAAIALLKALIGLITKSTVLLSDAIHSGSDLISVATSWIGLKIAQRQPTQRFPYGFYKAENLATLMVSVLIFWAGTEFLKEGIGQLLVFSQLELPYLAIATALIAIVTDFMIARYLGRVAAKINSSSLTAAAKEKTGDVFVSATVLVAVAADFFRLPYIEGIVIIFISLLLFKIALETGKEGLFVLMDVSPEEDLVSQVVATINQVPGVAECLDLKLRRAGPLLFGEAKVGIRRKVDITRAHQVADRVETAVIKKFPQIESLVVHIEPFVSDYRHIVIPVKKKGSLSVPVEPNFGQASFLLFVNLYRDKIKGYYFLKAPVSKDKTHLGLKRAKLIAKQQADLVVTGKIGEIAFYTLQTYLVDVYSLKGKTAKEVIDFFIKGELKPIIEPEKPKH